VTSDWAWNALASAAVLLLLVGALAGTAGYAATVARRQDRRLTRLVERLGSGPSASDLAEIDRIRDPRLRTSFARLADQVADAWILATIDPLTRIANRQALLARLHAEIERAGRYGRHLSVILIDIDHFKRLNDSFGHLAGDDVLHRVAQVLQANVRSVDIVGRYGGEEFMVVLPETDVDAAASIAEKLRRLVGREVVVLDGGDRAQVTLSAGVTGGTGGNLRLEGLIRDADAALYSAKALGRDQVYVFHEVEDDRLISRASIAPSARERAMLVGRAAMGAAARSLTDVLDRRPGWAGKPSTLIAEAASALAASLGLPSSEIERIRTASLLHDLGKLAIPDEILAKPSGLDEPEWRVVAEHPKIGQVVLEQAGSLRDAATIVLHHHEWYDGRGYPHGLRGEEIPVGARIVAVADAYEAMIAGRPYRDAVSHEEALAELRRHAGVQFDPEIVELFATLFADGVPWKANVHEADHGHGRTERADARDHARIHDELHARRRKTRPGEPAGPTEAPGRAGDAGLGPTGTEG
jgi:diguanylate cyclase (GGDEF)-like protein